MAAGAVSLRKSHDIVILSFCNIVKGQANYFDVAIYNPLLFAWVIQKEKWTFAFLVIHSPSRNGYGLLTYRK